MSLWTQEVLLHRRDDGFTLIETMTVLAIVAVLVGIGLVSFARYTHIADDSAIQLDLVTAVKVQVLNHLEQDTFTRDATALRALEPNLRYSVDGVNGTIVVTVEPDRGAEDVCLFGLSDSGAWFSVYHSVNAADRYGRSIPLQCTPVNAATWSTEGW
jgi:prepilin-type N-terminal cleavage/methylation domain-containing protein